MSGNFKFLGTVCLVILAMFGYEKYKAQQRENEFFNRLNSQQIPNEGLKTINSEIYDPNAITNYEFGVSIPVLANLKLVSGAVKNSYSFIDAQSGSRNDFIMVIPTYEDLNTVIQNLQSEGTPFTKIENGVFASINENGMTMNIAYNSSPNGGGISIIRVITGSPTISQQTIDALCNGIRFREATASLEERKQLMELDIQNQKIANQRSEVNRRSATDGDLLMARVQGIIDHCYSCD